MPTGARRFEWRALEGPLVQDNTSAGNFNSAWIYQYPGGTQLASDTTVSFGTSRTTRHA